MKQQPDRTIGAACPEGSSTPSALSGARSGKTQWAVERAVVPAHPLGRWFRDAQGRANQALAAAAERAVLMVAGVPLLLKGTL